MDDFDREGKEQEQGDFVVAIDSGDEGDDVLEDYKLMRKISEKESEKERKRSQAK